MLRLKKNFLECHPERGAKRGVEGSLWPPNNFGLVAVPGIKTSISSSYRDPSTARPPDLQKKRSGGRYAQDDTSRPIPLESCCGCPIHAPAALFSLPRRSGRRACPRRQGGPALRPHAHPPSQVHRNLRSEEHTSELQSLRHLVCRLLLE